MPQEMDYRPLGTGRVQPLDQQPQEARAERSRRLHRLRQRLVSTRLALVLIPDHPPVMAHGTQLHFLNREFDLRTVEKAYYQQYREIHSISAAGEERTH